FKVRVTAKIGNAHATSPEEDVEAQFPLMTQIVQEAVVQSAIAADWTAASGAGGDHNERGGWIMLNTATESYAIDAFPLGTFTGIEPHAYTDTARATIPPLSQPEYMVGHYHIHATLRDA